MSVKVNFFSVIVPIENIKKCKEYNTLTKVLGRYNQEVVDKITCHDTYLLKDSAMNYYDIEDILKFWKRQGLILTEKRNGQEYWKDVCVINASRGPTLPCDLLEFISNKEDSINGPYVYSKDKPRGKIVKSSI